MMSDDDVSEQAAVMSERAAASLRLCRGDDGWVLSRADGTPHVLR